MVNQIKYQGSSLSLPFNPKDPTIMHIDLNSAFATMEQQANPKLRGKPIAVAAYNSPAGCIVAPSIEAKRLGIVTGMRVKDGKMLCRDLIILTPDPWKYRVIHKQLKKVLLDYSDNVIPKSIDEFIVDLEGYSAFSKGMVIVATEMKRRIKEEVGEWLTVSIGVSPNRFLAKLGAGLHKPDGLDVIDKDNYLEIYSRLKLRDLTGIKTRNAMRLQSQGIYTVLDFYHSPIWKNKAAFESINGYYWYMRLHGWEIDDVEFGRHSFGNSYALPKPLITPEELSPILQKLVQKTGARLRKQAYVARGVHVALVYRDLGYWHRGVTIPDYVFDSRDIYKIAYQILTHAPYRRPVREIAVSVFNLEISEHTQLSLFDDIAKKQSLTKAIDQVNERWGNFVITPARMMGMEGIILDRISFGGIKELEDIVLN